MIATTGTTVPTFFEQFAMTAVTHATLDDALSEAPDGLSILFLWGLNCPNCDVAKASLLRAPARFAWPDVRWLQCNVYDDMPMATRFSLHGAPTFLVFRGGRSLGRMTGWPGADAFTAAIERQRAHAS
ncbi:thiol-disulfide isomerase [Ameyamaea chiangmaiensis NBRC 103196]|uniref:Thioredoxin family protein n=1 Tax=Ameyamaea chiangmaiensis TaxID=442969 RepID=A0A850PDN6_9PROT|nr:thioredoxin family protein [Ameyamaea chiangmaiensis]MBS4073607.1 thioredoxin family protein [Ameyamaea chiangmaiensis]NVN40052.1 thioredoxin family protein [Ameyamaea chiangmaiensis]GBQ69095.1 thiol-disulfide isomerase [Ameyamaea chiangmaiensis NBRC 103196]